MAPVFLVLHLSDNDSTALCNNAFLVQGHPVKDAVDSGGMEVYPQEHEDKYSEREISYGREKAV